MSEFNAMLLRACRDNEIDTVENCIHEGADVNTRTNSYGNNTPLILAAYWCNVEIVIILLENGADASLKDGYENTALDNAINRNELTMRNNKDRAALFSTIERILKTWEANNG